MLDGFEYSPRRRGNFLMLLLASFTNIPKAAPTALEESMVAFDDDDSPEDKGPCIG